MNETLNLTETNAKLVSSRFLPFAIISFILATGAAIGNLMLVTAIYKNPFRNLRTNSSLLVTNLALCDFIVGAVGGYGMFSYELFLYYGSFLSENVVNGIAATSGLAVVCGVGTVVVMAFDRYLAVKSPFSYTSKVTKYRIKGVLIVIWTYTFVINTIFFVAIPKNLGCFLSSHLHITIPACILSLTYIKMLQQVQKQNKQWKTNPRRVNVARQLSIRNIIERERKLTSAIKLLMAFFLLSFLPVYITMNIQYFWKHRTRLTWLRTFLEVSLLIVISNSFINPIIYALRVPKYRKAFRHAMGLRDNIVNIMMSAVGPI
ncbi:beta-1 adrenergic receptor-like [Actinia tenebrosa]|uniref:Beta-1 adrenergic receptor-like n=1 Tax=Actinia tenebrosa TaxID=6105 RepID=A0A6P8HQE0_ACTTE|nr:beta-1 adrenergic receptor-like [Actinia tenebrosa]